MRGHFATGADPNESSESLHHYLNRDDGNESFNGVSHLFMCDYIFL